MLKYILIFLVFSCPAFAQGAMEMFNTSRFARTIRLGNAYTGVAEGPEALFYNSAAIADQQAYSLVVSRGQGYALVFSDDPKDFDLAIVIPYENYGSFGFSLNTSSYDFSGTEFNENIYSISYARKILDNLYFGIAGNYFYESFTGYIRTIENPSGRVGKLTGSAFDFNLSAFFLLPEFMKISELDKFRAGIQFKNILNTKMKTESPVSDGTPSEGIKFQNIRAGLSYTFVPGLDKIAGLYPLGFMLAFDAVMLGADYNFTEWQPNFGLELTLLEMLQLSFGRENEIQIKETYSYSPQHPVNRYGFGVTVPFQKLFNLSYRLDFKFDYSISDWQKISENNSDTFQGYTVKNINDKALSAGISIGL
jgi:hypothetical protein